jgi:hypothetical protein
MHPSLPFLSLPAAALAAWLAASHWSASESYRYQVPRIVPVEDVPEVMNSRSPSDEEAVIRHTAFLPQTPPKPPTVLPTLVLHSVMIGKESNFATINGQLVQEGDRVSGYRVERIAPNGVELSSLGESRFIPMRPLHELARPAN